MQNKRLQSTAHKLSSGNGIRSLRRHFFIVGRGLNRDVRRKKYMNNLFRNICALVFLSISPNIYAAEAPTNATPEIINRAEGWVIATSRAEATDRYAVILKGNSDFSNWRVIPTTAETRLSKDLLGEACVISGTIETTPQDQQRRIRISKVEELIW